MSDENRIQGPIRRSKKSLSFAAEKGSKRDVLVAMRDILAKAVEDQETSKRDLASLSKRLMDIILDIEKFDAEEGSNAKPSDAKKSVTNPEEAWDGEAV